MTQHEVDAAERTAAVVERLAALLAGGTTSDSAWQHVASFAASEESPRLGRTGWRRRASWVEARLRVGIPRPARWRAGADDPVELTIARGVRAGERVGTMLREREEPSWRALGCAWSLAESTGAPLARGLGELAQTFRDFGASEREVQLALAGPSSAARLVMALPAVGILLGLALGFDSLGMLFGTPIGLACLGGGAALMVTAHLWNRALIAAASRREQLPGLAMDLTALGMLGGTSVAAVRPLVQRALDDAALGTGRHSTARTGLGGGRVDRVLELAREAGVPAASLLRSEAALERRDARAASSKKAAELGVRLMLPLGLCVLPAFLLLGVAPLILAVVTQTISRL
ncbi:type II secretion system F family protein [Pseudoclavibacter terrae]|uniref:type II secretion system F family protein n=1 Tax=Pseudoclavibacter terrae TaxID=1530195 RepID=UPI00232C349A|nr:hypothetical protein [Pseudoclavibacter terrae]